jgi:hypothetical protein
MQYESYSCADPGYILAPPCQAEIQREFNADAAALMLRTKNSGYEPMELYSFVLDARDLAASGRNIAVIGNYLKYGEAEYLYERSEKVLLVTLHAPRELRAYVIKWNAERVNDPSTLSDEKMALAVISAVPLALLGPVATFTSLRVDNNLYVQIGLMLLIALSAKNGILIVEVAREHRIFGGRPILEAAVDAARIRFRPIMMTSFAFILGVLPLVLATGAGANARRSLGLSVFTGMIASTCLAVVFVPAFFVVLQQLDERRKGKKKPSDGIAKANPSEVQHHGPAAG